MIKRLLVPLVALALWGCLPAIEAHATFPGENGRIAFRRFLNQEQDWGAVFTINPDGRGERQVTFPPPGVVDRNPDVSPDGRRIVFERQAQTSAEIYVVNADGTGLKRLTEGVGCSDCEAGPVFDESGACVAAVSVAGPSHRLDEQRIEQVLVRLLEVVGDVSAALGSNPTTPPSEGSGHVPGRNWRSVQLIEVD